MNIPGATATSYTTPATNAADSGSTFDVVVSDATGSVISSSAAAITSAAATLTVTAAPPTLTQQPQDQSVALGQTATFSVTANSVGPLSYQWQQNSVNIAGATSSSYTTPPATTADTGAIFQVIVSNALGSIASNPATLLVSVPAQDSYFVAVNGNDNADGSASSPFATLQRAQLAMRQSSLKVTQINAGTYYLLSPLTLTALDQGETWEAIPGATVVLSGGELLSGWASEGNGIYSAIAQNPVGLDLAIEGVRQTPAALGYDPQRPFTTGWRVLNPVQPHNFGVTFTVRPEDLTPSVKPGAVLQVLDFLRYTDQFTTVVSVDASNNTITVADQFNTGTSTPGISGSWRVLDDPADLGAPGEFAYDSVVSKVYVEPANPDSLNSDTVVAARLSTLIAVNSVSGITITGLTFSDTTSDRFVYSGAFNDKLATVMGAGLSNSTISGNMFLNAGNGISLSGSSNNSITGNGFEQMGGSGIFLTANSNGNNVTENNMTGLGKINVGSTGIHLENSAYNFIDDNIIDGSGRWGVDLYPSDGVSLVGNTVSNNIIRNTSQQTNDTGAIYSYAGTSPGYVREKTTITGNRIENIGGLLRDAAGSYKLGQTEGIYMDDQVSAVTMNNNVIESDGNGMFLCHGCATNSASNNVVILQPPAYYDLDSNGSSYSTGDMTYNGTTRVDLLPSYFPASAATTTIIVQLSGQASGNTNAAFNVQADGVIIGTGTATNSLATYVFTAQLAPHQIHRIGIGLTNGANTGASTTALHNLALFVNNTAVNLVAPEATGAYGAYGFVAGNDSLPVTNFSSTHNIVYRDGGSSQDLMDWTDWADASYLDPNPGSVDDNVLYQNVAKAGDSVFGSQVTDANSVLANPLFTNAKTGDYTLQQDSPALALGFSASGVPLAP
ncbi:MAG TPA: right-handed parallel beta-helix repeat-containing protein [Terracidiphilus sp.]|jgi:parallel beta-helix repeat protein